MGKKRGEVWLTVHLDGSAEARLALRHAVETVQDEAPRKWRRRSNEAPFLWLNPAWLSFCREQGRPTRVAIANCGSFAISREHERQLKRFFDAGPQAAFVRFKATHLLLKVVARFGEEPKGKYDWMSLAESRPAQEVLKELGWQRAAQLPADYFSKSRLTLLRTYRPATSIEDARLMMSVLRPVQGPWVVSGTYSKQVAIYLRGCGVAVVGHILEKLVRQPQQEQDNAQTETVPNLPRKSGRRHPTPSPSTIDQQADAHLRSINSPAD